jgi:uncharacterized protein YqeY
MSLREQLDQDLKAAMLARQAEKVSALRMIKAAVRNKEIDAAHSTLDDAGMIAVLNSLKKKGEDSVAQYKTGGRQDLVDKEQAELNVIQAYLPQAMSADEITAIITKAITESGAAGAKDMGKVMKLVTPQTTGRADGKAVSEQVKAALTHL